MNASVDLTPELLTQITAIVGENRIKTDADSLENWGRDHTKHFDPNPSVIVFPTSTEQVQAIVKLANQFNVAITPSGGRTGLSAGAVAANGEIVVSMDKMNQILEFFPADRMVRVQAGVVTEQLQNYAEEQGMYYPVDFASSGSSQIGGNIGTNAGGIKVIKYGMTRNWVLGLTVVTGKGDILRLNKGMIKNATGYALQHLFIGGEGTLGLVTEAEIKLESIVRTRKEKEINQVIHSILEDIIIKEESAQKLYMAVVEILKILGNYYAELYQDEDIEELKDIKVMFSRRYDLYKFKHIEELENYLKEMVIVICSGKENTKKKSIEMQIKSF